MDAQHLQHVNIDQTTLREIPRRQWVAAKPSLALHALLSVSWIAYLWSIGLFSSPEEGGALPQLSFVDEIILVALLATIVGVFTTIGAALMNKAIAAPMSAISALAMVAIGTTCGFAGHPISAWGPSTATAAVIGIGSVMLMGRRAR